MENRKDITNKGLDAPLEGEENRSQKNPSNADMEKNQLDDHSKVNEQDHEKSCELSDQVSDIEEDEDSSGSEMEYKIPRPPKYVNLAGLTFDIPEIDSDTPLEKIPDPDKPEYDIRRFYYSGFERSPPSSPPRKLSREETQNMFAEQSASWNPLSSPVQGAKNDMTFHNRFPDYLELDLNDFLFIDPIFPPNGDYTLKGMISNLKSNISTPKSELATSLCQPPAPGFSPHSSESIPSILNNVESVSLIDSIISKFEPRSSDSKTFISKSDQCSSSVLQNESSTSNIESSITKSLSSKDFLPILDTEPTKSKSVVSTPTLDKGYSKSFSSLSETESASNSKSFTPNCDSYSLKNIPPSSEDLTNSLKDFELTNSKILVSTPTFAEDFSKSFSTLSETESTSNSKSFTPNCDSYSLRNIPPSSEDLTNSLKDIGLTNSKSLVSTPTFDEDSSKSFSSLSETESASNSKSFTPNCDSYSLKNIPPSSEDLTNSLKDFELTNSKILVSTPTFAEDFSKSFSTLSETESTSNSKSFTPNCDSYSLRNIPPSSEDLTNSLNDIGLTNSKSLVSTPTFDEDSSKSFSSLSETESVSNSKSFTLNCDSYSLKNIPPSSEDLTNSLKDFELTNSKILVSTPTFDEDFSKSFSTLSETESTSNSKSFTPNCDSYSLKNIPTPTEDLITYLKDIESINSKCLVSIATFDEDSLKSLSSASENESVSISKRSTSNCDPHSLKNIPPLSEDLTTALEDIEPSIFEPSILIDDLSIYLNQSDGTKSPNNIASTAENGLCSMEELFSSKFDSPSLKDELSVYLNQSNALINDPCSLENLSSSIQEPTKCDTYTLTNGLLTSPNQTSSKHDEKISKDLPSTSKDKPSLSDSQISIAKFDPVHLQTLMSFLNSKPLTSKSESSISKSESCTSTAFTFNSNSDPSTSISQSSILKIRKRPSKILKLPKRQPSTFKNESSTLKNDPLFFNGLSSSSKTESTFKSQQSDSKYDLCPMKEISPSWSKFYSPTLKNAPSTSQSQLLTTKYNLSLTENVPSTLKNNSKDLESVSKFSPPILQDKLSISLSKPSTSKDVSTSDKEPISKSQPPISKSGKYTWDDYELPKKFPPLPKMKPPTLKCDPRLLKNNLLATEDGQICWEKFDVAILRNEPSTSQSSTSILKFDPSCPNIFIPSSNADVSISKKEETYNLRQISTQLIERAFKVIDNPKYCIEFTSYPPNYKTDTCSKAAEEPIVDEPYSLLELLEGQELLGDEINPYQLSSSGTSQNVKVPPDEEIKARSVRTGIPFNELRELYTAIVENNEIRKILYDMTVENALTNVNPISKFESHEEYLEAERKFMERAEALEKYNLCMQALHRAKKKKTKRSSKEKEQNEVAKIKSLPSSPSLNSDVLSEPPFTYEDCETQEIGPKYMNWVAVNAEKEIGKPVAIFDYKDFNPQYNTRPLWLDPDFDFNAPVEHKHNLKIDAQFDNVDEAILLEALYTEERVLAIMDQRRNMYTAQHIIQYQKKNNKPLKEDLPPKNDLQPVRKDDEIPTEVRVRQIKEYREEIAQQNPKYQPEIANQNQLQLGQYQSRYQLQNLKQYLENYQLQYLAQNQRQCQNEYEQQYQTPYPAEYHSQHTTYCKPVNQFQNQPQYPSNYPLQDQSQFVTHLENPSNYLEHEQSQSLTEYQPYSPNYNQYPMELMYPSNCKGLSIYQGQPSTLGNEKDPLSASFPILLHPSMSPKESAVETDANKIKNTNISSESSPKSTKKKCRPGINVRRQRALRKLYEKNKKIPSERKEGETLTTVEVSQIEEARQKILENKTENETIYQPQYLRYESQNQPQYQFPNPQQYYQPYNQQEYQGQYYPQYKSEFKFQNYPQYESDYLQNQSQQLTHYQPVNRYKYQQQYQEENQLQDQTRHIPQYHQPYGANYDQYPMELMYPSNYNSSTSNDERSTYQRQPFSMQESVSPIKYYTPAMRDELLSSQNQPSTSNYNSPTSNDERSTYQRQPFSMQEFVSPIKYYTPAMRDELLSSQNQPSTSNYNSPTSNDERSAYQRQPFSMQEFVSPIKYYTPAMRDELLSSQNQPSTSNYNSPTSNDERSTYQRQPFFMQDFVSPIKYYTPAMRDELLSSQNQPSTSNYNSSTSNDERSTYQRQPFSMQEFVSPIKYYTPAMRDELLSSQNQPSTSNYNSSTSNDERSTYQRQPFSMQEFVSPIKYYTPAMRDELLSSQNQPSTSNYDENLYQPQGKSEDLVEPKPQCGPNYEPKFPSQFRPCRSDDSRCRLLNQTLYKAPIYTYKIPGGMPQVFFQAIKLNPIPEERELEEEEEERQWVIEMAELIRKKLLLIESLVQRSANSSLSNVENPHLSAAPLPPPFPLPPIPPPMLPEETARETYASKLKKALNTPGGVGNGVRKTSDRNMTFVRSKPLLLSAVRQSRRNLEHTKNEVKISPPNRDAKKNASNPKTTFVKSIPPHETAVKQSRNNVELTKDIGKNSPPDRDAVKNTSNSKTTFVKPPKMAVRQSKSNFDLTKDVQKTTNPEMTFTGREPSPKPDKKQAKRNSCHSRIFKKSEVENKENAPDGDAVENASNTNKTFAKSEPPPKPVLRQSSSNLELTEDAGKITNPEMTSSSNDPSPKSNVKQAKRRSKRKKNRRRNSQKLDEENKENIKKRVTFKDPVAIVCTTPTVAKNQGARPKLQSALKNGNRQNIKSETSIQNILTPNQEIEQKQGIKRKIEE